MAEITFGRLVTVCMYSVNLEVIYQKLEDSIKTMRYKEQNSKMT